MKERPILFSAPMVRAILEGRKTQTRRRIKMRGYEMDEKEGKAWPYRMTWAHGDPDGSEWMQCPYGQPGDRLWVRETWAEIQGKVYFAADYKFGGAGDLIGVLGKWKPSIHMPREASRITLEITDVRVERLQDITEPEAIAEGVECGIAKHGDGYMEQEEPTEVFERLWDSINGEGAWAQNPFVWAITFKLIKP